MEEAPVPTLEETNNSDEKMLDSNEFKVEKGNRTYDFLIAKTQDKIIIKCLYYELKFNQNDLSSLTKIMFNSLDESYEFIKNLFQQNKVLIKDVKKSMIKVILNVLDPIRIKEKGIEIILLPQIKDFKDLMFEFMDKNYSLENELKIIKMDNEYIKKENNQLKEQNIRIIYDINTLKSDIEFLKNQINTINMNINMNNQQQNMMQNQMMNQIDANPMMNQMNPMMNPMEENQMMNQMDANPMMNQNPLMNQMNQNSLMNQMNQNPLMNQMINNENNFMMINSNNNNNIIQGNQNNSMMNINMNQMNNDMNLNRQNLMMNNMNLSNNIVTINFIYTNTKDKTKINKIVKVKCYKTERISDIIKKFRILNYDYDDIYIFIYDKKNITKSTKTAGEEGISDGDNIIVYQTNK